jgi:uncharacterized protein (TIGR03437 family)
MLKQCAICLFLAQAAFGQTIWFEPNQGQVHRSVEFLARSSGGYAYFGRDKMVVRDVRMDLIGANRKSAAEFGQATGGISSYFIGRTEKDWHTGIPHYERVQYRDVYAGIDLVYYGSGLNIEYDFVVRPGGDPNEIRLAYSKPVRLDENGDLLIAGLRQKRPKVFQGSREITCDYLVRNNEVRLAVAAYDHAHTLTVDPVLEFSTYLGGPAEEHGFGIAIDSAGFVYLAGGSQSPASPTLNPFQNTTALILSPVVFKITPDGQKIVYYAFVGNNSWDAANTIAVDSAGSAVISGTTRNPNFPLKNPFQTQFKAIYDNAFVTKLSPDGRSLIYSSYLGGSNWDHGQAIALDASGNAVVAGYTLSSDFPVLNASQPHFGGGYSDCFLSKVSASGTLILSTYFGGSGGEACYGVALDKSGNAYIAGSSNSQDLPLKNPIQTTTSPRIAYTPLLAKFSPDGLLLYSSFIGGPTAGTAWAVAVGAAGDIYAAGSVDGQFTTKNALQSSTQSPGTGFLMSLDPTGQTIRFGTFFGGSGMDVITGLALDAVGGIYVVGWTTSSDFPAKSSFQSFKGGGVCQCDAFAAKLSPGAQSIIYSTLLGGTNGDFGEGITLDAAGSAYLIGTTLSQDFPVKDAFQGAFGGAFDFFFAKISDNTPLPPSPLVLNPSRLLFRYTQGGNAPALQTVTVSGPAFTTGTSAAWLNVSTSGSNLNVAVNPAGLAPNIYTGSVSLTPQAATPASVDVTLTILAPPPVLTSVDPTLVPMGSNDTTITVHGSGFTSSSILQVNGVPWTVTPVQFVDASTLRFSMPASYFTVQYNHTIAVQNLQSALSNILAVSVGVPAPLFTSMSVVNAASYVAGAIAPGEIVTVFGSNFGAQGSTQVLFNDIPATLVYVSATQLAATVPYPVAGAQSTTLMITSNGVSSTPVTLSVTDAAPAIFTADASGTGQAAALNQDNTVNGTSNPAPAGSVVALYGTGGGALTTDTLPRLILPVTATVGGVPATVYYAGIAPGLVQGAMQVNVQIPGGAMPGLAVPVAITVGNATSKIVTLAIQ